MFAAIALFSNSATLGAYTFLLLDSGCRSIKYDNPQVTRMHDCRKCLQIVCWSAVLMICFSTLLFLLCANGIFIQSRPTKLMFTLIWAVASIGILSTPFAFTVTQIQTGQCTLTEVGRLSIAGLTSVAIFDVAVFVSISGRIISNCSVTTQQSLFGIANTYRISKALVETGQFYFL